MNEINKPNETVKESVIQFEAVTFGYAGSKGLVLDGMSLDVLKGSLTAILGPNGAGEQLLAAHPGMVAAALRDDQT